MYHVNNSYSNKQKIISRARSGVIRLQVLVQPRASRDEIVGVHSNHLKIRLSAPPVEGAANKALTRLLSKKLKIPASSIEIKKGQKGRQKLVEIEGGNLDEIKSLLGL